MEQDNLFDLPTMDLDFGLTDITTTEIQDQAQEASLGVLDIDF